MIKASCEWGVKIKKNKSENPFWFFYIISRMLYKPYSHINSIFPLRPIKSESEKAENLCKIQFHIFFFCFFLFSTFIHIPLAVRGEYQHEISNIKNMSTKGKAFFANKKKLKNIFSSNLSLAIIKSAFKLLWVCEGRGAKKKKSKRHELFMKDDFCR